MRVLALAGWWMAPESLRACLPAGADVEELDYLSLPDLISVAERLRGRQYDLVVGWSLGGQLAAHALWQGWIQTEHLVLIGSAYQFVQASDVRDAMAPQAFRRFTSDYSQDTFKIQHLFQKLLLKGSLPEKQDIFWHSGSPYLGYWLMQLAYLPVWGPHRLPPTLVIHGVKDAVVPFEQTRHWQLAISQCTIAKFRDSGHTIPLHAPEKVRRRINRFLASE